MKVLFVGEGQTDIGSPDFAQAPRRATGVLYILSRKVCPAIDAECLAIYWRELTILRGEKKGNIYAARVATAIALANRHGCEGVVVVVDREMTKENRTEEMEIGVSRGQLATGFPHPTVCGEAILSIEAWMLGSPLALATTLKLDTEKILCEYKPAQVEDFNPRSGKPEKHSKNLIEKIAAKANRDDGTAFREEVAENMDIDELCRNCKNGFKPFADRLRAAFGPRLAL
jgi:hypothetical protein